VTRGQASAPSCAFAQMQARRVADAPAQDDERKSPRAPRSVLLAPRRQSFPTCRSVEGDGCHRQPRALCTTSAMYPRWSMVSARRSCRPLKALDRPGQLVRVHVRVGQRRDALAAQKVKAGAHVALVRSARQLGQTALHAAEDHKIRQGIEHGKPFGQPLSGPRYRRKSLRLIDLLRKSPAPAGYFYSRRAILLGRRTPSWAIVGAGQRLYIAPQAARRRNPQDYAENPGFLVSSRTCGYHRRLPDLSIHY
jgi:hypothetical protein